MVLVGARGFSSQRNGLRRPNCAGLWRVHQRSRSTARGELFIHGPQRFSNQEWAGFQSAVPKETKLVGVRIRTTQIYASSVQTTKSRCSEAPPSVFQKRKGTCGRRVTCPVCERTRDLKRRSPSWWKSTAARGTSQLLCETFSRLQSSTTTIPTTPAECRSPQVRGSCRRNTDGVTQGDESAPFALRFYI